jgi:hypothetical protein
MGAAWGAGVAAAIGALSPGNDFQRGLLGISEALIKNRWAVVVDSKSSVPFLFLVICHKGKVSEARKTFSFPYLIYHRKMAILKTCYTDSVAIAFIDSENFR